MDERVWKDILERYGQRVSLWRESGEREIKAFFSRSGRGPLGRSPPLWGWHPGGSISIWDRRRRRWRGWKYYVGRGGPLCP